MSGREAALVCLGLGAADALHWCQSQRVPMMELALKFSLWSILII